MPEIRLEFEGAIANLIIDAPARGNSLDRELLQQLTAHLELLGDPASRPDDVRVVVLSGAGTRAFSTGYHLPSLLAELEVGPSVSDFASHPLEQALRALEELSLPTIAVIQGNAYGAGCELALACDLRLASDRAKLCMPPAKLGVLYSATGMRRLLELTGPAFTRELLFTATVVDAARALSIGLLNRVVAHPDLEAATATLCAEIAGNASLSIQHTKTILRRYLAPAALGEQELSEIARLRQECFDSPEFAARTARWR
ncbi:MAG: enoyl-CoA hydratase/isomerase family protein [Planctomycetes bacterium]|nr:enoyl-CoA hydratase/isomerase family protein [Planctomycetota bacterium]